MTVTVVGAGMAGAACAAALRAGGEDVRVVDRGRAPGGRMASPELHGRRVDLGAGYFTVRDDGFRSVVDGWAAAGLAREWTDRFDGQSSAGPMRWAAPGGLRSLVRALLDGIEVETAELTELPNGPVVLAMPDPQAARLVDVPDAVAFEPVIAVAAGFAERTWSFAHAAFVNDAPDVTFVADDGDRRGDGAPVLVAHTSPDRARRHLDAPDGAIAPVLAALDLPEPVWTHAHRWTFAKPAGQHNAPYGLLDGRVGLAGDQWCPDGSPRVESAWLSGTRLAAALLARP